MGLFYHKNLFLFVIITCTIFVLLCQSVECRGGRGGGGGRSSGGRSSSGRGYSGGGGGGSTSGGSGGGKGSWAVGIGAMFGGLGLVGLTFLVVYICYKCSKPNENKNQSAMKGGQILKLPSSPVAQNQYVTPSSSQNGVPNGQIWTSGSLEKTQMTQQHQVPIPMANMGKTSHTKPLSMKRPPPEYTTAIQMPNFMPRPIPTKSKTKNIRQTFML